jgi:hypothetical protein
MNRTRPPKQKPPYIQAWLALSLPLVAWFSQVFIASLLRHAGPVFHLFAAVMQFGLLVGGLVFGIWALAVRGRSGVGVIFPAAVGLAISIGTFLIIGLLFVAAVLA